MISFSIVLNCYREGDLIYKAIKSIDNQTDQDFHLIIVNDCSPDVKTNQICKEIERNKKEAKVIWNKINLGHGLSRNVAFELADTDVLIFLDADDILTEDAVSSIRQCFNNHPEADFVFGDYYLHHIERETSDAIDCSVLADKNGKLLPGMLANNWIMLGTSPCKKSLWERINGYAKEFSNTANDIDFWQRALLHGAQGYYINKSIYQYNQSLYGLNLSANFLKGLDKCNFKNFDFILYYNKNHKDAFNIALKNKDYEKVIGWAKYQFNVKNRKSPLILLILIIPKSFLPFFIKFFNTLKKVKGRF